MRSKLKNRIGMTLAEMLIVVAIILVLAGVAFIAVTNYLRGLGQVERDGIAKEIYFAAQNHLTAAYGQGYLGVTDFGTKGNATDDANKEVYYFTVNGSLPDTAAIGQMLPFGSIDETVRIGGSYIIRYQRDTGLVLDVFYCSRSGGPQRFNHSLSGSEYATIMGLRGDSNKNSRRSYTDGSILGWYGGMSADDLPTLSLKEPTLRIVNAEKLYVEVTDPNNGVTGASLKLIITGEKSGSKKAYELKIGTSDMDRVKYYNNTYTIILDDVTISKLHFGNIVADSGSGFIPGEDIEVQAVAFSTSALANIAYSQKGIENSLFGSIDEVAGTGSTAYIGNIRHLENLDKAVSNLDTSTIAVKAAEQTDSFSWIDFEKNNKKIESKSTTGSESEAGFESVRVYSFNDSPTAEGTYKPIEPEYSLTYDGKNYSISDIKVKNAADAGVFGKTTTVTKISNLELIDFDIKSSATGGALAGSLSGCTVSNVLARNSTDASKANIDSPVAGGLIGTMNSCTVNYSAAAVIVNASNTAGGLVGKAESGTIKGCYSGGHTKKASYDEWVKETSNSFDVTATTAGGLIGDSKATVSDSYSTCSVSGSTTAGGFAGTATGSISNCYATGLIDQEGSGTAVYAFLGSGSPTLTGNYYYSLVNMVQKEEEGAKEGETEPMLPYSGYKTDTGLSNMRPIDLNAEKYNEYVGQPSTWNPAIAYDSVLIQYYGGKYPLRTIETLLGTTLAPTGSDPGDSDITYFVKIHYGDWPSPEVFFLN